MCKGYFFILFAYFSVLGCGREGSGDPPPTGEELSAIYCASCHQLPLPGALPRSIWADVVLPRMGNRLGVYDSVYSRAAALALAPRGNSPELLAARYPESSVLSAGEWSVIKEYYLANSPRDLSVDTVRMAEATSLFRPLFPDLYLSPPAGTLFEFSPNSPGVLYGDANQGRLIRFDAELNAQSAVELGEGVASVEWADGGDAYFSVLGSFAPTDAPVGSVWRMDGQGKLTPIIRELRRPSKVAVSDLNQDGRPELTIAEFGKERGRLAWWTEDRPGKWTPHELFSGPGATEVIPVDLNRDGHQELLALLAQGDERIVSYRHTSAGFREETLLRFPPSNGSSSLDTLDWNGDGLIDLLYTAGDNADYRPVLKPYHGVYVFVQTLSGKFEQTVFLPLPGAYDAEVADFDQDGDLDVMAISFFPDFVCQPEQGIVYFERTAPADFTAHQLTAATAGRWIRLAAADWDGDGDLDVGAASLAFETVPDGGEVARWVRQGLPFVIWENQLR